MQSSDDYMMRQVSSYRDNPAMASSPEMQNYYDDIPVHSQPGNHAPSSFQSTSDLANPNFRNSQPSGFAEAPYMPQANPYANLEAPRTSEWLEKTQQSNKRSKFIVIGSILLLAILIGVGVGVGVTLSKKNNNDSSAPTNVPTGTNPNDPANFQKNPLLKHAFWGIAYTPIGAQLPDCGATQDQVIIDIQQMSQITSNIRLYGADCNQSSLVLAAIQLSKVNISVWLGNYPALNDNGTAFNRQNGELQTALEQFGAANVAGVTVGNEFILDAVTAAGSNSPNGAAGDAAAAQLIPYINTTRSMLASLNLGKTIPVGNADAGSYFNTKVLEAVDYGMSNVHPWFANQSIENAAGWTWDFFETVNVAAAKALPNTPNMYIAETGWPTNTSTFNYNPNDGPSVASVANLQSYINTFACQATQNGTEYFFFEYNDQPWQAADYGGVEGYWGLFDANGNFKNLTLPDCPP
ncbi:glycoside hydrolase family 17 protein [Chiua virens]|nr:glycoside hydrolase family 17 protein [Chiua virens]